MIGTLTDREAWEWYLKPALERAQRLQDARNRADGTIVEPETEEEALALLRQLGVTGVPSSNGD